MAIEVTYDKITFSWRAPEHPNGIIAYYSINQRSSSEEAWQEYDRVTNTSAEVVVDCQPGDVIYDFSVAAVTKDGTTQYVGDSAHTQAKMCTAMSKLFLPLLEDVHQNNLECQRNLLDLAECLSHLQMCCFVERYYDNMSVGHMRYCLCIFEANSFETKNRTCMTGHSKSFYAVKAGCTNTCMKMASPSFSNCFDVEVLLTHWVAFNVH